MRRLALSPLLIAQGVAVRRRALRLPEPTGPRSGRAGAGSPLSVLILGDSSAAGVGVAHQDHALAGQLVKELGARFDVTWQLRAATGATTRSTLGKQAMAPARPFDVVIVALGVNDITHAVPLWLWQRQQRRLITDLAQRHRPARIYLTGVPPMGSFPVLPQPLRSVLGQQALRFDAALARLITGYPQVTHVPFNITPDPALMAEDGFHPNATLYALWAKEMASRIVTDWPEPNRQTAISCGRMRRESPRPGCATPPIAAFRRR